MKHPKKRIVRMDSVRFDLKPTYSELAEKNSGFTLVELMVSMVIGLSVMMGVFQVFSSTKTSTRLLGAEAELQENARFAFSVMTSIVQEAGNFGCQASTSLSNNSLVNPVNNTFRPWNIIEGWEAKNTSYGEKYSANVDSGVSAITTMHWSSSGGASKDSGTKSKKYSDVFKVWYTKKQNAKLSDFSGGILTFSPLDLDKGDVITINDCRSVSFAQVCFCEENECQGSDTKANINPGACTNPGNISLKFDNLNMDTASIGILEQAIFFVGKRSDSTTGYKTNMPALYMRNLGYKGKPGNKVEILEGVESLQVLYGEDTDADHSPNRYLSADLVADWNNVVSVKISLLLRSQKNNLITGRQTISFNGKEIKTEDTDRYLRRVFTSTISLRNRNIGF